MSKGPDLQESVLTDAGGVHVEKSYVEDEFPVPAIRFEITAPDEDVSVRLTDQIPESFPMDRVGFHPDFESDNWTAYQDHRVEFTRDLSAEESVVTVYGIRTDDPEEVAPFLIEPTLERTDAAGAASSDVEDVIGEDSGETVREVVQNEDASLAGLEEAKEERAAAEADIEAAVEAADVELDDDAADDPLAPAEADDAASADDAADPDLDVDGPDEDLDLDLEDPTDEGDAEAGAGSDLDADAAEAAAAGVDATDEESPDAELDIDVPEEGLDLEDPADGGDEQVQSLDDEQPDSDLDLDIDDPADDLGHDDAETATPEVAAVDADTSGKPDAASESVAAQLADEIRTGEVAEDDLELLREELDIDAPNSVDVRISRLQAQVSDLEAYTGALEQFIDEEGSAQEVVEEFDARLNDVSATVDELSGRVDDGEVERAELGTEVHGIGDEVSEVADRVDETQGDVSAAESRLVELSENVEDVEESVEFAEEELSSLANGVDAHETELEQLDDHLADVESDLSSVSGRVNNLMGRVQELEATHEDVEGVAGDVEAVEADIADIRAELEDVQEFRTRINSAFGGGGGE